MISSTVMAQTIKTEGVVFSIYSFIAAAYNITLYPQTHSVNNLLSCDNPTVWA